jgi:hypothetical protein
MTIVLKLTLLDILSLRSNCKVFLDASSHARAARVVMRYIYIHELR